LRRVVSYNVTLLNREIVSRAKLCLVSAFRDIVKDCPKMRNLPKMFLRSFENVGPGAQSFCLYIYLPTRSFICLPDNS